MIPKYMTATSIRDVPDDTEVMADEQVRKLALITEALEELEDLGLHRYIEGTDRLVGNDQLRVHRQGPGDADSLPLSARKLVWIAAGLPCAQADRFQQLGNGELTLARLDHLVEEECLAQRLPDGHPRIQGRVRILEDDLELPAAQSHR